MIFSYNWLKKYVSDLPAPEAVEQAIIFHAFEVESLEKTADDYLLDIKILPDRNHDCLCHRGVARELSAILNLNFQEEVGEDLVVGKDPELEVKIESPEFCRRYVGLRVKGVETNTSPDWLAKPLEAIGQRSISNIVDATNYVMFALGQPMHAFDADKVQGGITVRLAKEGERMTTLDGRELNLDQNVLLIADDAGPLALAGIKGGNRAEVDENTKNIILESASFDPVLIRKTSAKFNLRTDASKRFENDLSSETALPAMLLLATILQKTAGGEYCGMVDVYPTRPEIKEIIINPANINKRLGIEVPETEMKKILEKLGIEVSTDNPDWRLKIPYWRVDLLEEANIVEEVGRLYGYDKIKPEILPPFENKLNIGDAEKRFAVVNKVREILVSNGFTEVLGYALTDRGEIELANPLASDKGFLRTNLSDWLAQKIKFNLDYVLFETEPVKIFEIGRVFTKDGEETRLGIGIGYRKKIKGRNAQEELAQICQKLGIEGDKKGDEILAIQEISFDQLAKDYKDDSPAKLDDYLAPDFKYRSIPAYPRIIRDVAVWVPEAVEVEEVMAVIKKTVSNLCVEGPVLFDEFAKEGRKSLAFRLVFQSYEKTLSDDEANSEMIKVIESLESDSGWEVRK